jgi:hypothetical protein
MSEKTHAPDGEDAVPFDGFDGGVTAVAELPSTDVLDAAAVSQESRPDAGPPIATPSGAECSNCQAGMAPGQTFCRRCGYYPALKTFVEVQPWEADESAQAAAERPKSTIEVWKSLIPPWGWGLIAGVAVLLAISVAARLMVPAGAERAIWTYAQFGIGIAMLISAHIACYMFAIMVNDTLGPIDIVLKPWVIWGATLGELPKTFRRVALGTWGLSAALFAAFVVAGVRYDEIIDWGKVPPKKKKKPAVAVPIDAAGDEKSMEEAIEDFKNQAGVAVASDADRLKQKGNRQKMAKCVVIGYTPNRETDFHTLLLAVEEDGKWRFAGEVRDGVPIEVRSILNRRLPTLRRSSPVLPCDVTAVWLEPKVVCTVWFEDWNSEMRLGKPFFDKLQPDFELPQKNAP